MRLPVSAALAALLLLGPPAWAADKPAAKPAAKTVSTVKKPAKAPTAKRSGKAVSGKAVKKKPAVKKSAARSGGRAAAKAAPAGRRDAADGDGIRVGDGVGMAPSGRDPTGCAQYRMTGAPVRTMFYRTIDGDFTTDRNEAFCG